MRKLIVGAFAFALAAAAAPAEAQLRPFTIGIQGGPSLARGNLEREAEDGYHVQGSIELSLPLLPIGARADLLWQEFSDQSGGDFRQIGGLANGVLRLPLPLLSPYVVGGPGLFRISEPDAQHGNHAHAGEDENSVGWNVGVGLRFGLLGLAAVAEARYIDTGGEHQSIPLSVGIRF